MQSNTPDKNASGYDPRDAKLAQAVTATVLQLIVGTAKPGEAQEIVDPDVAIDGVLMALALVLEQAPECKRPRALERQAEVYGRQIAAYASRAREAFDRSGIHPIDALLDRFGSVQKSAETVN